MSPYDGVPEQEWHRVTNDLVDRHPLTRAELVALVGDAWTDVWATTIGRGEASLAYAGLSPPAQVTGHFFEKVLGRHASIAYPGMWRNGVGDEKDIHCIPNPDYSFEVKTSGQRGLKIYGNRSAGKSGDQPRKDKTGYFLTVNFYGERISLIRFGWIDARDWRAQKSESGQASSLSDAVYAGKLEVLSGDYLLRASIRILEGVGPQLALAMNEAGIHTYQDLLARGEEFPRFRAARARALEICQKFEL